MIRTGAAVLTFLFLSAFVAAEESTVSVRGIILDRETKNPLFGASVSLESESGKITGATADEQGGFLIEQITAGAYTVTSTFVGYKQFTTVKTFASAEDAFITIELEQSATNIDEVVVAGSKSEDNNEAINTMAFISARSFNIEHGEKVAASLGDPSRLALSFAGVRGQSDILNGIVVRGNAPKGVLWRVEGVEVPSPNHFSQEGYGAGAVCMLSGQVIGTSDFYSGAFPAEYGNAMSAVFDIRMKKGDEQKRRYFFQAGMMGIEGGIEGPFVKGKRATYVANYRYSTLAVLEKMGMDIGNTVTAYQDLAIKLNFPTKKAGTFSVFSVSGKSIITIKEDNNRGTKLEEKIKTYEMGFYGISHLYQINKKNLLKSVVMFSANRELLKKDELRYSTNKIEPDYQQRGGNMYFRNLVQLDTRFSNRSSLRSGIITSNMRFNLDDLYYGGSRSQPTVQYQTDGATYMLQAFSQWKYALTEKWTLHTGLHFIYFGLNHHYNFEPRLAVEGRVHRKHTVAFAAGLHSRLESMATYMVVDPWYNTKPNETLNFTKAAHFGISYEYAPVRHLKIKIEEYYQYLYGVPISTDESSSFSMINFQDRYVTMELVNKGRGVNYGVELTVEKSFAKNYYIMANGSLFESKYYAADGVWRSSRYNSNFVTSLTAGKDFLFGKKKQWTFGLNARTLWAGGERTWETDYEEQIKNYFRIDTRVSISRQRQLIKWTFALDIQNAANRKNESTLQEIESAGILPVMSFRIEL